MTLSDITANAGSAPTLLVLLTLLGYAGAALLLRRRVVSGRFNWLLAASVALHLFTAHQLLRGPTGLDLSLLKVLALISGVVNLVVLTSALHKPVHNLYPLLLPAASLFLAGALLSPAGQPLQASAALQGHIVVSLLAYSLLTVAALQALLVAYQDWQLHHKRQNALMRRLPPLQTMESLLFEFIWIGQILLTLSLISGFLYYEDFFAQHLIHKVVFSQIAWIFFAVLLWGRHRLGWRGYTAVRLTWAGFGAIVLGYVGSKFVLEYLI